MIKQVLDMTMKYQEKVEYDNVRRQHKEIFHLFQKLRKKISYHIKCEECLMEIRNLRKPENHIDTQEQLESHKQKHDDLLKSLEKLEQEFDKHIKLYDLIHIHRL